MESIFGTISLMRVEESETSNRPATGDLQTKLIYSNV